MMGPSTNWLSFSLSPMEMLRSSESQFMGYENSSTDSPHYLIDNFYTNGKNPNFFYFSIYKKESYVLFGCWEATGKGYTCWYFCGKYIQKKYASCYGFRKVFIFILFSQRSRGTIFAKLRSSSHYFFFKILFMLHQKKKKFH